MFLRSLTLRGFKSFADRTVIDLQPGITVIVGPNGSGKSNIVDALAWVFGTQGPKQLRGQKMEDVIFAGTPSRPALGRTEVGVTIDNSAGLLPIDAAEITIARLLYRSGESEYSINGVACRLLDVQELLSDSGVGRQLHVLVGQGQIDAVLLSRPEDRRAVIEEAAGVLKHRRRKERALRRLESMEANLQRLSDLSRELRRQLRPLERQAEAARRHGDLMAQLELLQRFLAGRELSALRARHSQAVMVRSDLDQSREELRQRRDDLESGLVGSAERSSALGRELESARDVESRLRSVTDRLSSLASLAAERARSATLRIEALSDDPRPRLQGEIEDARAIEAEAEAELAALHAQRHAIEADLAALAERRRSLSGLEPESPGPGLAELRAELAAAEDARRRSDDDASRIASQIAQVDEAIERREEERARLRVEIEQLDAAATPLTDQLAAAEAARSRAADEVSVLEDRRRRAETNVFRLRGDLEARRAALESASAGSPGRRAASHLPDALGVLGDLLDIDAGAEAAVAAALGRDVDALTLIAEGEDAFRRLKHAGAAAAGVVDLAAITPRPARPDGDDVAAPALRRSVRARPGPHAAAVERLLDVRLAGVHLCAGWRSAWELSRGHPEGVFVTSDGDLITGDGMARVGGDDAPALLQGPAIRDLERELDGAERDLHEVSALLERRRHDLDGVSGEESACREALHQADAVLTTTAGALARVESETDEMRRQAESLSAHLEELAERSRSDEARIETLSADLPTRQADEEARAERRAAWEADAAALDDELHRRQNDRGQVEGRSGALGERVAAARSRRAEAERLLADDEAGRQQRQSAYADAIAAREGAEAVARRAARAADVAGRRAGEASDSRSAVGERVAAASGQAEGNRDALRAATAELEAVGERLRRAELEEAELRLRLEVAEQARADLGPDDVPDAELPEGLLPEEAPVRIRHLRDDIERLGLINPLALEEHDAISQRYAFLSGQLDDVRSSRRELEKVVAAVDAKIVQLFTSAFEDVARHFSDLFARLFPGGTGRLVLTDPADLLETGVEVQARPAGKRVDKLTLLSGGERSLAAVAFLFAVFRARPSPFYVLDEVEAALDDVNLDRFIGLLEEFREEAQLLVVTHQKRTMESADCLYGVSMRDDGTTRVISQRMSDIDALAAAARPEMGAPGAPASRAAPRSN